MAARLPVEIVQFISSNIDNVTTHLAFSQTCSTVRKLYDEKYWKNVLYSLGYGRSLIHKSIKWSFLPVMLTRHIATCVICQRVDAKHSYLKEDTDVKVLSKAQVPLSEKLDMMKGIKEVASSQGDAGPTKEDLDFEYYDNTHLIAYYFFEAKAENRIHLLPNNLQKLYSIHEKKHGKRMSNDEYRNTSLVVNHIVISSLLATTMPVSTLSLEIEEPAFAWAWEGYGICGITPNTVTNKVNKDGITVYDLFRAGANYNKKPGAGVEYTTFYGVSLQRATATATFVYDDAEAY